MGDPYLIKIVLAGIIGGASISLLGTVIIGMRIPFLAIYVSHGAMAGAIFGSLLLGLPEIPCTLAGALLSALVLGSLTPLGLKQNENVAIGILFSVSMGLVFLGMGLYKGPKSQVLELMWGSISFTLWKDLYIICAVSAVLVLFFVLFAKELRAIIFSRMLAAASGIHETLVWVLFLVLSGLIITSNLRIVGGLMIFSLITNPPAAAFRLCRGFAGVSLLSAALGAASGLGGVLISYFWPLPVGACIALFSAGIYAIAVVIQRFTMHEE